MKTLEIFERIKSHPGVTVRNHISPEVNLANRQAPKKRDRFGQKVTVGMKAEMKKLEAEGFSRVQIARKVGVVSATVYNHLGALVRTKKRLRK